MKYRLALFVALSAAFVAGLLLPRTESTAADKAPSSFARTTIDLGMVVSDLDKSAKFYTDVIGFKEVKGFSVGADFCADAGLTDSKELKIRVFILGEGESATRLKLMEVPGVKTKKSDNAFIHAQFGFRYITIFITDTTAALGRLEKAGIKPLAKGPVALPKALSEKDFLTVVHDPDGNSVELVGPKK